MEDAFEIRDGVLYMREIEVPGHPDFRMFAGTASGGAQSESDFRAGYHQAIADMLSAVQHTGKFEKGYLHGVDALRSLMKSHGHLPANDLKAWVNGIGQRWLNDVPKDVQALPPALEVNQDR